MAFDQTLTTSFKQDILLGVHDLETDDIKMALFLATADLGAGTTVYTTTGETSGTGYVAGGKTLTGVTVQDNAVSFQTIIDAQGQTLTLRFSGTIDGDSLAGNFDTDFGAIPVTGVRR